MKNTRLFISVVVASVSGIADDQLIAVQPVGNAFTYQGQLKKNGLPVTNKSPGCDFTFRLFDSPSGGSQIGSDLPLTVSVVDGLFTVNELEFGSGAFQGEARWLEIDVECPGDDIARTLTPRQPITPAPFALHAQSSGGRCVATIANLRALTPPTNGAATCMRVLGYHSPGDGGGGEFYWDAAADCNEKPTDCEDEGTVLERCYKPSDPCASDCSWENCPAGLCRGTCPGRWKRLTEGSFVSVRWFGARGDGKTPDTDAFNAAMSASLFEKGHCSVSGNFCNLYIDPDPCPAGETCVAAGRRLEIPAGTYLVDTIRPIRDDVWIQGAGRQATILKSLRGKDVIRKDAQTSPGGILIEDLSIMGFGAQGNVGHGIHFTQPDPNNPGLRQVHDATIRNVYISRCGGSGLRLRNTFTLLLEGVTVDDCGDHLFNLDGGNTTVLIRCYAQRVADGKAGYRIRGANPILIACNGLNGGSNSDWGVFGATVAEDGAAAFCHPTLMGCNVEGFTRRGCYFKVGSWGNFFGTKFKALSAGSNDGKVKAIEFDHIPGDQLPIFDGTSDLFLDTAVASWANGQPIHGDGALLSFNTSDPRPGDPVTSQGPRGIYNPASGRVTPIPTAAKHGTAGSNEIALRLNTVRLDGLRIGGLSEITVHLSNAVDWNPINLAHGSVTSTTVSVTGALVGDTVSVGFSKPVPPGVLLAGSVTKIHTVTVTLLNMSGSDVNLDGGKVRSDVWGHSSCVADHPNGFVEIGEECDDGDDTNPDDGCHNCRQRSSCFGGIPDGNPTGFEECDDGNSIPGDGCDPNCLIETCGNGVLQCGELCDDGYKDACGTCNADCKEAGTGAICGDGTICPETEECDDGNTDPGDGCDEDCRRE